MSVELKRYHFYLVSVVRDEGSETFASDLSEACDVFSNFGSSSLRMKKKGLLRTFEFAFGDATESDIDRTSRLKLRRPRKRIQLPEFPAPEQLVFNDNLFPADLYV